MTAATGKPRGRPKGCQKTGGRVAGKSLDKQARQLVSSQLAGSILETFQRLGGVDDMLKWAAANRTVFYTQVLSRLYPAAAKDDEPGNTYNQQFNLGDTFESARRVAFLLSSSLNADPSRAPIIDVTPQVETVETPQEACHPAEQFRPEAVEDPNKQRWIEELHLTPEERRDRDLVRNTLESTIESYHGGLAEQGHGPIRSPGSVDRDPRAAQRDRILRRNKLL